MAYDIKTARFSVRDDGTVFDYEGPEELETRLGRVHGLTRISTDSDSDSSVGIREDPWLKEYVVQKTPRDGYVRVFLKPRALPPMTPSCGELLQEAQQFRFAWWLVLFPSLALFVVMLLTVLVGEGLRDAFDPRQASQLE